MWRLGGLLAAEPPAGANDSLIVMVGGIVVAAIGALSLVLVEVVKGRNSRGPAQTSTTATTSSTVDLQALAADVAVLKDWRVETRRADDIHDRTVHGLVGDVGDLVRWHDREHPDWRP